MRQYGLRWPLGKQLIPFPFTIAQTLRVTSATVNVLYLGICMFSALTLRRVSKTFALHCSRDCTCHIGYCKPSLHMHQYGLR